MAVDLDVSRLQQELQGIYNERQVVNERIRSYVPGRGRGRGPPGGSADFGRGAPFSGRGGSGRGVGPGPYSGPQDFRGPSPARGRDLPQSLANRISDRPTRGSNAFGDRPGRDQPQGSVRDRLGSRLSSAISQDFQRPQRPEPSASTPDTAEPAGSRKRLLSAVVVGGQTLQPLQQQEEEHVATKRPRPDDSEDNPAAKKRNRRMFGFLNQTLQKCKDDSNDFRKSKVAQQRDEALKRAEERRREELIKFKAEFKREMASKRQSEVNKKRELNMQADVKRAEIACVQKILHRSKIANFIQTSASPPLCWLPGKHNTATQALLQQEQAKLDVYKQEEADKVEAKRQQVVAAVASMAAALEAADARRREAALNPPRPVAAPSAAAVGETDAANAGADAAAPMQADDIETADQEDAEPDDLEDGAYVVMEEEDEEGSQAHEQAQPAGSQLPPQASNAGDAEPMSTEDDRYVATAYDADEEEHRASDDLAQAEDPPAPKAAELPASAAVDKAADAAALVGSLDDAAQDTVHAVRPAADTADAPALEKRAKPSTSAERAEETNVTGEEPMQE